GSPVPSPGHRETLPTDDTLALSPGREPHQAPYRHFQGAGVLGKGRSQVGGWSGPGRNRGRGRYPRLSRTATLFLARLGNQSCPFRALVVPKVGLFGPTAATTSELIPQLRIAPGSV